MMPNMVPASMLPKDEGVTTEAKPSSLQAKAQEAEGKVGGLKRQVEQLSQALSEAKELLSRWDARLVTLKELEAEGFVKLSDVANGEASRILKEGSES